jgi:seryl-tRNA synthetase
MLDLKFIRDNPDAVREAIALKGVALDLNALLAADRDLLELKKKLQQLQEDKNANAKKVPAASKEERPPLIEKGRQIGADIEKMKPEIQTAEEKLQKLLWLVPNIPAPEAPRGKTDAENVEVRRVGEPPKFDFTPRDHVQLLEMHNWAEFVRIANVAGTRSYSLKNEMVLLEFALLRFSLDYMRGKGFNLITVPSMVREFTLFGTGHFPTGRDQVYHLPADDLYLSGTAEVPINSLHAGEILKETDLPLLYGGFSPCFRREAGSAGKDTRGLIRVHQFMKVEQFVLCKNDSAESRKWHLELLKTSEEIVQALEMPYRVVEVCTGDMGAGKVRMYDIETWVPSEKTYRETHSCSSLGDWQARRANLRYRDANGEVKFVHTLNNTALATPRIIAPFIENHQQKDGSVRVPAKLQPYLGGLKTLVGK